MPPVAGTKSMMGAELDPVGAPGVFTSIGELSGSLDINITRNMIAALVHNSTVGRVIPSDIIIVEPFDIEVNYVYGSPSHAALKNHALNGTKFSIRFVGPNGVVETDEMIFPGYLASWRESNPVDDRRMATGSFHPDGPFTIDGVEYGTVV